MKILSIEFVNNWSWSLTFEKMPKNKIKRIFISMGDEIKTGKEDIILSQNVTLLKKFKERLRTVCRMGGNYNFDNMVNLEPLLREMSKCYCLIATNQKLYEIGKSVNDRCYLIPNGLDLKTWSQVKMKVRNFTVGFCGNISNPFYRDYKGYDMTKAACDNLGIKFKTALYQDKQIPHEKMRDMFYSKIDVLVHPTKGEGCSNTLMEACACAIPIITTRAAGYHGENLENKKNVLFCERNVRSIQDCIMMLQRFPELQKTLSANVRIFAEKHHDIDMISKKYKLIFEECYKNNRGQKNGYKS
jgi:glycosyltransferase involved in cell wall biosynthesis